MSKLAETISRLTSMLYNKLGAAKADKEPVPQISDMGFVIDDGTDSFTGSFYLEGNVVVFIGLWPSNMNDGSLQGALFNTGLRYWLRHAEAIGVNVHLRAQGAPIFVFSRRYEELTNTEEFGKSLIAIWEYNRPHFSGRLAQAPMPNQPGYLGMLYGRSVNDKMEWELPLTHSNWIFGHPPKRKTND